MRLERVSTTLRSAIQTHLGEEVTPQRELQQPGDYLGVMINGMSFEPTDTRGGALSDSMTRDRELRRRRSWTDR